jgi:hypothetical protein
LAIAYKITPEDFWKAFIDEKAQEDFYVRLHVQEDLHNKAANELQAKNNEISKAFKLGKPEGDAKQTDTITGATD